MANCRQATSHYLSQCWPRYMSPHGVTRSKWLNKLSRCSRLERWCFARDPLPRILIQIPRRFPFEITRWYQQWCTGCHFCWPLPSNMSLWVEALSCRKINRCQRSPKLFPTRYLSLYCGRVLHCTLCHRENSSVTQTTPEPTLSRLIWGGWPREKKTPLATLPNPVLSRLSGHSDPIVLEPFNIILWYSGVPRTPNLLKISSDIKSDCRNGFFSTLHTDMLTKGQ